MLILLSVITIFLCFIHILFNYNEKARLLKKIPGPKDAFIIGNTLEIIVSPVELMALGRKFTRKWKNIFRFYAFPIGAVIIYNPDDIETMISGMKHNEKSMVYKFLTPWLRNGLLVSSGAKWQQRRKILTPAFHFNILREFCVILQENSQRLVDTLHKTEGESVDIVPILSEFTLNSICETAMGTKLSEETTGAGRSYKQAIYNVGGLCYERFVRAYLYIDFLFNLTSMGTKLKQHLAIVHGFTERVIKDRKYYSAKYGTNINQELEDNEDSDSYIYKKNKKIAMLDLLILAEKDGLIDDIGIQEEVDTFMFEGHDTTASGLTFCLMLLANHKNIQDKIAAELKEIFGDSTRLATMNDVSNMRYLECCIKESLRLYPPVHLISRSLNENVTLSGYAVPAGTMCHILILDLHRREDLFKNALVFDPDRFLPENSVGRHPYSYIPFSAGPRNCIGQKFAMMEMKSAISEVLRNFELLPVTHPDEIEFKADLVLRNSGPVYVKFVKRYN